ncbi:hypothetical protein [Roseateles sp.]|uniref:hypothetical protein n=1 Tax=Roseateles sp. TaxID=1971397 RepID=UPI00396477E1
MCVNSGKAKNRQNRPHVKGTMAARKSSFETKFSHWIATQNAHVDRHGVPGADLRPW